MLLQCSHPDTTAPTRTCVIGILLRSSSCMDELFDSLHHQQQNEGELLGLFFVDIAWKYFPFLHAATSMGSPPRLCAVSHIIKPVKHQFYIKYDVVSNVATTWWLKCSTSFFPRPYRRTLCCWCVVGWLLFLERTFLLASTSTVSI